MVMDKEAKKKAAALQKLLSDRMSDEGFQNIRQFHMESRIPLSQETIRRAFSDTD
jgi:hypothetical protein